MQKLYKVNEIFSSIQGEGRHSGRPATFVRFSMCNKSCFFCDTDFDAFDEMSLKEITEKCIEHENLIIVLTGGEPTLQVDPIMVAYLKKKGFQVHIETNGSNRVEGLGLDHISMSPKQPATETLAQNVDDVKILYPYIEGMTPEDFHNFGEIRLQPIDGPDYKENLKGAIAECKKHGYTLSIQLHKVIGVE